MPTPILPTKAQLAGYTYSPATLNADEEVETYLTVTNNYDFVLKIIQAFRDGTTHNYNIDGLIVTAPATSFIYISDATTIANLIVYLTQDLYGYKYTVSMFSIVAAGLASTYIPATGTGYSITLGPNTGKKCILVSWI